MSAVNRGKESAFVPATLRTVFEYEPETGLLTWRHRQGKAAFNGKLAGKQAGSVCGKYRYVTIGEAKLLVHRIIWAMVHGGWPVGEIDHEDGDPLNNVLSNLRPASPRQNCQNKRCPLGIVPLKGVTELPEGGFRARITGPRGRKSLGIYPNAHAAARAYDSAAVVLHGEFAVTNQSLGLLEQQHA